MNLHTLFSLALIACGCAASHHATAPSAIGIARSSDELVAVLERPGPIALQSVDSADWEVPLSGLLNLEHPNAKAAGLKCTIGSNLELGIGTAAMLHVAVAFPEVDCDAFPADTIGPFYHDGEIIAKPLDLGPPYAIVPDGPGLGVELDEQALKRWQSA